MYKFLAVAIGALCGVGQFFVLQYTLKPLAEGKNPQIGKMFFLKMPIPLALLLGYAFVDINLLAFAGGSFCVGMILAAVINHLATLKKKG